MKDYQERVVQEKIELDQKKNALSDYMHGDFYANLPAVDQGLLMVQLEFMKGYSDTLARRIDLFS